MWFTADELQQVGSNVNDVLRRVVSPTEERIEQQVVFLGQANCLDQR
jgi:hypothetical protein